MARERDPSREVFWRRTLRRHARSGLTVREFCTQGGLTATAYHHWRREIARRDAESVSLERDLPCEPTLVPVQLVDDTGGLAPIEIVAENGFVVRVGQAATAEHLRRVLQVVSDLG